MPWSCWKVLFQTLTWLGSVQRVLPKLYLLPPNTVGVGGSPVINSLASCLSPPYKPSSTSSFIFLVAESSKLFGFLSAVTVISSSGTSSATSTFSLLAVTIVSGISVAAASATSTFVPLAVIVSFSITSP